MGTTAKPKVAFVIGHTLWSPGAKSKFFNQSEFNFWFDYSCELKEIGDVFLHESPFGYTARQRKMSVETSKYDLVFELHFNAAHESANGCEALYYFRNQKTKHLSQLFCKTYTDLTSARNRGAKALVNKKDRGYGFVYEQKADAIILEPFFGTSDFDCSKFNISHFIASVQKTINAYQNYSI